MRAACEEMCPSAEISFRQRNHLIHKLEATESTAKGPRTKFVADRHKMVKEYTRSAADTNHSNPAVLRTFAALNRTVQYLNDLYDELCDTDQFPAAFSFISDRMRAVRQDVVMQRLPGAEAVALLQAMIPFYIRSDYKCKTSQAAVATYEWKLHATQIEECFCRWAEEIERLDGSSERNAVDENISICFLLRKASTPTALHDVYIWKDRLSPSSFAWLRTMIESSRSGNFVRFFADLPNQPDVVKFSAVDVVLRVRQHAVTAISTGFKCKNAKLGVDLLADWLGFCGNVDLAERFLSFHGYNRMSSDKQLVVSDISCLLDSHNPVDSKIQHEFVAISSFIS